jgi:hypothetical protein
MDLIIKKETMIKKNAHDINDIYDIDKGVSIRDKAIFYLNHVQWIYNHNCRNWEAAHMELYIKPYIKPLARKEPLR